MRQVPTQTRTEPRHVVSARLVSTPNLTLLSVHSVNLGGTATLPGQQAATSVILALLLIIPRGELPAALYVLQVGCMIDLDINYHEFMIVITDIYMAFCF